MALHSPQNSILLSTSVYVEYNLQSVHSSFSSITVDVTIDQQTQILCIIANHEQMLNTAPHSSGLVMKMWLREMLVWIGITFLSFIDRNSSFLSNLPTCWITHLGLKCTTFLSIRTGESWDFLSLLSLFWFLSKTCRFCSVRVVKHKEYVYGKGLPTSSCGLKFSWKYNWSSGYRDPFPWWKWHLVSAVYSITSILSSLSSPNYAILLTVFKSLGFSQAEAGNC